MDLDEALPLTDIMPTEAEKPDWTFLEVPSSLGPEWAINLLLPKAWTHHPIDGQVVDLDQGPAPLGVFASTADLSQPTLVSAGALRANDAVSLMTYFTAYAGAAEMPLLAVQPIDLDVLQGIDGLVDQGNGTLLRLMMTESAGRVLVLAGMAFSQEWETHARTLAAIMVSTELSVPGEPTMALR